MERPRVSHRSCSIVRCRAIPLFKAVTSVPRTLAVSPLGDADPEEGLLERGARRGQVDRIGLDGPLERTLGLAPGLLRPLEVDLARQVGRLGHHHDPVRSHLEEAADDRERLLRPALADAQLPDAEHRHERRVVRQHPELTLDPRAAGPTSTVSE